MRFFFKCVSCYGTARMDPPIEDSSKLAVEQTRRLVSPTVEDAVAAVRSTLRRRTRSLSRLGHGDWKPSLHAIAEDIVVAPVKARAKAARRTRRRCAESTRSVHSRGDSYGRDPMPMIAVPTFAPTPFMF